MHIFGLPVELVILDVDGVILDILGGLRRNLEEAALYFGLPIHPIAQSIDDIAAGKIRIKGNARDSARMFWPCMDEEEISSFINYFYEVERASPYALIEGSFEVISFLRNQGIALALATNNPMKNLLWRLETANIDPAWFAAIVTKDNRYFKPHPRTFDPIFDAVPISRDHAWYVGDLQIDWEMACNAGVRFIAVLTGGVPRSAFLNEGVAAAHILPRLHDALGIIDLD